jgi:hypothetical protein
MVWFTAPDLLLATSLMRALQRTETFGSVEGPDPYVRPVPRCLPFHQRNDDQTARKPAKQVAAQRPRWTAAHNCPAERVCVSHDQRAR